MEGTYVSEEGLRDLQKLLCQEPPSRRRRVSEDPGAAAVGIAERPASFLALPAPPTKTTTDDKTTTNAIMNAVDDRDLRAKQRLRDAKALADLMYRSRMAKRDNAETTTPSDCMNHEPCLDSQMLYDMIEG